ncbi:hypothetical protein [Candidatus Deferrimicrobium sp.]|uniref:hypothetical protein n=1 Tax=Candidatus Deferrimicrobium sp. TaxID=3060586 RepID=UPI002ED3C427
MMLRASWIAVALLLVLFLPCRAAEPGAVYGRIGPVEVLGADRPRLLFGAGVFDYWDKAGKRSPAGKVELRIGKKLWFLGPAIGLLANTHGGIYGYAGVYTDFAWKKFVLTPLLGIGVYRRGNYLDLGGGTGVP